MKSVIIIPARLESKRFPGKVLQDIDGQTLLERCYKSLLPFRAFIATPDKEIVDEVTIWLSRERIIMTSSSCRNGTERVAEAVNTIGLEDDDIVIDVQADQFGFQNLDFIEEISQLLEYGAELVTVVCPLKSEEDIHDANIVKAHVNVEVGKLDTIGWFARKIPPAFSEPMNLYRHIGVYAARKRMFDWYLNTPPSPTEIMLSLEQLRWRKPFVPCYISKAPCVIDTPEDM